MNRFHIMNRFRIIGRVAVIVAGLGGALLGLSASAVPAAVAGTMTPVGGDPQARPGLASPRPEPCSRIRRPPLPATSGCRLTFAQAPAGLQVAVRRTLGPPAASAGSAVQQAELTAADGAPGDQFGLAVAISGSTAVVGAPSQAVGRRITGAAYVFVRSGTTWHRQAKLTTPAHSPVSDDLGWSVALSGPTAVVGDPRHNSFRGAAFVFVRSGTTWHRQAKLTAPAHGFQQSLGQSVAVSGNTAVAGAPSTGTAYVFVRSGSTWYRQAKLTGAVGSFGSSVALSSIPASRTVAVVGSPGENSFTGAAYVFTRSGTTWSQRAKLTAAHGAANDSFGNSVALSGPTAVVGAPGAEAAYVFTGSGTTWSQRAKLSAAAAEFGDSVALCGPTAVLGAPGKNADTGAAYVFVKG
jgi:FG-GAP repeat